MSPFHERNKMKLTTFANLLALGLVLIFAATGCRKNPYGVTPLPGARAGVVGGDRLTGLDPGERIDSEHQFLPGGGPMADLGDLDNFHHDRATLAANTVYFDFDSAAIKGSERPKVDAVASFLRNAPPSVALLVEGHCDERGTEEYNRALGERRALAVREQLAMAGADVSRVVTRSYGEDRPADPGRTEAAYAKNRRGEFVVLTPK
jgi:peptidoglycan-associated lipoprotein